MLAQGMYRDAPVVPTTAAAVAVEELELIETSAAVCFQSARQSFSCRSRLEASCRRLSIWSFGFLLLARALVCAAPECLTRSTAPRFVASRAGVVDTTGNTSDAMTKLSSSKSAVLSIAASSSLMKSASSSMQRCVWSLDQYSTAQCYVSVVSVSMIVVSTCYSDILEFLACTFRVDIASRTLEKCSLFSILVEITIGYFTFYNRARVRLQRTSLESLERIFVFILSLTVGPAVCCVQFAWVSIVIQTNLSI